MDSLFPDPHIRIAGEPENIKKAKDMVAVRLESKVNRSPFNAVQKHHVIDCGLRMRVMEP